MNYKLKLNLISHQFSVLPLYKKILFYLVPVIGVGCYLFLFHINPSENQIQKKKLQELQNKILEHNRKVNTKIKMLEILKHIDTSSKKYRIVFESLKQNGKSLDMIFKGTNKSITDFIHYCEYFNSFSKIEQLKISTFNTPNTTLKNVQMKLSFHNYKYKQKSMISKNAANPKRDQFTLTAIVGSYVLLNNQWIGLNERMNNYSLHKINRQSVELLYQTNYQEKKTLTVRMFNESI